MTGDGIREAGADGPTPEGHISLSLYESLGSLKLGVACSELGLEKIVLIPLEKDKKERSRRKNRCNKCT